MENEITVQGLHLTNAFAPASTHRREEKRGAGGGGRGGAWSESVDVSQTTIS